MSATLKNFIDGQFIEVACDSYAEVVNPAKDETLARVPKSSPKDLNDAVQAAKVIYIIISIFKLIYRH